MSYCLVHGSGCNMPTFCNYLLFNSHKNRPQDSGQRRIAPSYAESKPTTAISERKWKNLSNWEKRDYIATGCQLICTAAVLAACVLRFFLEPPIIIGLFIGGVLGAVFLTAYRIYNDRS